jgi:hypothetical protein
LVQETLLTYQRVKDVSKYYQIPEQFIDKPCIANLLAGDEGISRNISGLILTTELFKKGIEPEKIEGILRKWNIDKCDPSLKEIEIKHILQSGFKTNREGKPKYDYGCNNELNAFCISEGKDGCFYYQAYVKDIIRVTEPDYIKLKWQHVLTVREFLMIAYIIPSLERKRSFPRGSRIYASIREYSAMSGINQRFITSILKSLSHYGLIQHKAGIGRNWEKKASEVTRILPPPEIPKEYAEDMQALKRYKNINKQLKEGVKIG